MHTLVITEHPEFGKVRTVEAGGRVWFCARDVASALGYANPKDAVNRHCRPKGVRVHDLLTAGGRQKVKFIDEGNLYRLMAGSRLPSAERFESWIFDDLVPQTLKEGGYLLDIKGETDSELLSRALLLAENKIKERDRHISVLEEKNAQNAIKLSRQAPKVRYFEEVLHSASTYTTTQIAKELGMSGRELNYRLKLLGVQFRQSGTWMLTARYHKEGYTRTHTHIWQNRNGETGTAMHTVWTERGRLFIHHLLNFNLGYQA
ncbi:phage antirepressor [Phocaeicola dorei]|uniref:phage antirepressor n=1 Tax=Phocaeicola dorei TaxID=357276 RepID=UPI000B3AF92D|nr:phage antirepressor KilAC domain-containing protein [Phocaeicola dorei]OUP95254.1 toxin Bro [Phocaeicola dorei]